MSLDWQIFCKSTYSEDYAPRCFGEFFLFGHPPGDPTYLDWLLTAWGWTLAVSGLALLIALVLGITIGTLRTIAPQTFLGKLVVFIANAWVELFRNIPVLVQVFPWYHVIPMLFPVLKSVPSFLLVSLALGFFTSARIAEQIKAGIFSLPKGQSFAAQSLGMTKLQTYRFVILPMALRIVIPPLTSECMNIVKNSSVAFAVSVSELTLFAMQTQEETSKGIEMYLAVTVLYMLTALSVNRVMAMIERKSRIPGFISPSHPSGAH
jgi:glutamate/aspartate transport system permease protein